MHPPKPTLPAPLARTRRGSALAATMMVVLALVTLLSIAALVTSQFGRFAARAEGDDELMAAGDAALEYIYAQWQATTTPIFNKGTQPVSADFAKMESTMLDKLNKGGMSFASGVTFSLVQLRLSSDNGVEDTGSKATGTPTSNVPDYPGWQGTTYSYIGKVTLTPADTGFHLGFFTNSRPTLTLTRLFQVTQVPLFQAAIFYENKLEIHPGAAMAISGLVHTNGDLYARGFSSLEFKKEVSHVGSYTPTSDPNLTAGLDGFGYHLMPGVNYNTPAPTLDSTNTQVKPIDPFGGTAQTDNNLHKIVDVPGSGDTANKQIAYNNAALIITVNSDPLSSTPLIITDGAGKALTNTDDIANVTKAVTVGSGNAFYDGRESSYVTATTLDMSLLAKATAAATPVTPLQMAFTSKQTDPNRGGALAMGTVYIRDSNTSGSNLHAVRLVNGSVLGQNVTVASNNPVYIQGDYNTGGTGAAVASNNGGDGTIPTTSSGGTSTSAGGTSTYNRYSSAVMADAVTILSSAWKDGLPSQYPIYYPYYPYETGLRKAAATTVNTAILSGDIPSNYNNNGTPSGGAHNFPRFLENWNGINFTYYGSLVEAFRSMTADSTWQTGQVYYWPNRRWWFDINFLNGNQPPGVPNGISYSRGRWTRNNS